MFTQDEKDAMKDEAVRAYKRTYGAPDDFSEQFHVMKGIEALASVVFAKTDRLGLAAGYKGKQCPLCGGSTGIYSYYRDGGSTLYHGTCSIDPDYTWPNPEYNVR